MKPLVLLVIIAVLFAALAIAIPLLKARLGGFTAVNAADATQYRLRSVVFTPAERSFLGVVDGVLPEGISWLGKVRLGDVFTTRKGLTASQRASAWNRINQKHVDFLLVRMSDFAPLAGIELDDTSHDAEDRQDRDAFVDQVFRCGGIPLLHVAAQAAYNPNELRSKITALLAAPATPINTAT
jgi:hypothetical protein